MIGSLKKFFEKRNGDSETNNGEVASHDVRMAACALFVEMARIDEEFTTDEIVSILDILQNKYGLSRKLADALMAEAEQELEKSVDLWQFARLINENYAPNEKIEIVETLWGMVYADGVMDRYEHYLMNKIKNLLRLSQNQVIEAKLRILESNKTGKSH